MISILGPCLEVGLQIITQYNHWSLICVNNVSFNVNYELDFIPEVEIKAVKVNSHLGICGQPMLLYIQEPGKDMTYLHIDPKRF